VISDPIIEEVRRTRKEIEAEHGNDLGGSGTIFHGQAEEQSRKESRLQTQEAARSADAMML
jgi:hypothetical protein